MKLKVWSLVCCKKTAKASRWSPRYHHQPRDVAMYSLDVKEMATHIRFGRDNHKWLVLLPVLWQTSWLASKCPKCKFAEGHSKRSVLPTSLLQGRYMFSLRCSRHMEIVDNDDMTGCSEVLDLCTLTVHEQGRV